MLQWGTGTATPEASIRQTSAYVGDGVSGCPPGFSKDDFALVERR